MKGDPMPEELIIKHCSPTLAGIKTGNIITCRETDREENRVFVRHLNSILVPKGLRAMLFSRGEDLSEMIYIYRPEKLKKDLSDETAREILEKTDYPVGNPTYCVIKLLERLRHSSGFPHEIGLFLGYPAEDVKGFIEKGAGCCKCCGYWKVYGNEDEAQKTFEQYRKCTRVYCECWGRHGSIGKLTVPECQ